MKARWIRLGPIGQKEFDSAYASIAAAQPRDAAPILLWGAHSSDDAARYLFALIAPLKFAPGLRRRWLPWGLAAAVATYRQFGVPAYFHGDGDGIALHGRRIAAATLREIGECVVIGASFLARFPDACLATPSGELEQAFRLRLEAQHGWQFDTCWPSEHERAEPLRGRRPILF